MCYWSSTIHHQVNIPCLIHTNRLPPLVSTHKCLLAVFNCLLLKIYISQTISFPRSICCPDRRNKCASWWLSQGCLSCQSKNNVAILALGTRGSRKTHTLLKWRGQREHYQWYSINNHRWSGKGKARSHQSSACVKRKDSKKYTFLSLSADDLGQR